MPELRRHPDAAMTLLLVRHAQAADRMEWQDEDWLRPLTAKGVKQAAVLVDWLLGHDISSVRSSPAIRCVETVKPLCAQAGLGLQIEDRMMEGTALPMPTSPGLHVLCAHGDNIPHLLSRLGIEWEACQKGSVWQVDFDQTGRVVQTQYFAPKELRKSA